MRSSVHRCRRSPVLISTAPGSGRAGTNFPSRPFTSRPPTSSCQYGLIDQSDYAHSKPPSATFFPYLKQKRDCPVVRVFPAANSARGCKIRTEVRKSTRKTTNDANRSDPAMGDSVRDEEWWRYCRCRRNCASSQKCRHPTRLLFFHASRSKAGNVHSLVISNESPTCAALPAPLSNSDRKNRVRSSGTPAALRREKPILISSSIENCNRSKLWDMYLKLI